MLGADPVTGMAQRFRADLATRFVDADDRDGLRRDAHAIASAAGMLGFGGLSRDCKGLEQACDGGAELVRPLATVLAARAAVDRCLADLSPGPR